MEIKILAHKFKFQYSNLISLALVVFFPLFVPNSQIVTGSIVNATLAYNSIKKHPKSFLYLLVIPSLVSLFQSAILGPFSNSLYYFLLPIWISNYIFTLIIHKFPKHKIFSIILKVAILFSFTMLFVNNNLVPNAVISSMVLNQIVTSTIGIILSQLITKTLNGNLAKTG